ncbi:MAG TPA: acyltransferase [Mycobacterium sp.]|uniref:acyltransferase family protein n=1 Tax=Mycolicibacterium sp. TaxID=2320850 RepID=UPI0025D100C8|nr:acyltransferase [Mycolicibacterium sp.]HPX36044.1 acyltransferase [Mycobacterium sp.]HQC75847.1 acyltransferase [Mycobacterium sp.]
MTSSPAASSDVDQGGLEAVSTVDRIPALTGVRAFAALIVVGTHAAYTTGKYTHGYVGLLYSRLEIGVPIFFVLSGYLLFGPWVRAAQAGGAAPSLGRYAWRRIRRIMPAYVLTVLGAFLLYHFHEAGPNPGHTWYGLLRNLTLTHIYTDGYMFSHIHQGLTQMWSLAVEVAFYAALPVIAYLVLTVLCRRQWRPRLALLGLAVFALISPAWMVFVHTAEHLPDGAKLWLPGYLAWFIGGMMLTVLAAMGVRCYWFIALPLVVVSYFIVSTPVAGEPTTSPSGLAQAVVKTMFYAVIATLVVAPPALGDRGLYERLLASRPMVWLGEISYELFLVHLVMMELAMTQVLHWQVYTGEAATLFVVTMALSVPVAWVLHRITRVRD